MAKRLITDPGTLRERRTLITNLVEVAKQYRAAGGYRSHAETAMMSSIKRLEEHEQEHGPTPWGEVLG